MKQLDEVEGFFKLLNKNGVQYLVIGGVAVNIHGFTRSTGDLDIWCNPSKPNYIRLITTVREFGFDTTDLEKITDYETSGFIRIPLDSFYVELLFAIDGKIKFEAACDRSFDFKINSTVIKVIGYDDLIQNKIMSRRPKDLEDITQLERRKNKPS